MAERSTLARPYAEAAFEQAREEGKLEQWSEMLEFLKGVVSDRTMAGIIADPRVERARLVELLLDIGEGRLTETGKNFVRVLSYYRRLELLPEIAAVYGELRRRFEGRSRVEVISAYELDPKFEKAIAEAMAKRLDREVDISVQVDKSLIGGVIVRAGDLVIDASLRGRLAQLAQALG